MATNVNEDRGFDFDLTLLEKYYQVFHQEKKQKEISKRWSDGLMDRRTC